MKLDLSEISNWAEFEDLSAAYFREVSQRNDNQLSEVIVEPSGIGPDGGRDILLKFRLHDSIYSFERKWVVQCKFYNKPVTKSVLSTVNIPTLIHEYGADGYLLITNITPTSGVTNMFENLGQRCKFRYSYMIWDSSVFVQNLRMMPDLIEQYFPSYQLFLDQKKRKYNI